MSKDESVEKIENIIAHGWHIERSDKGIAQDIYDAGFRDITDLMDWLEKRIKYLDSECKTIVDTGIFLNWRNYEQG
jgi:hypothetical protein